MNKNKDNSIFINRLDSLINSMNNCICQINLLLKNTTKYNDLILNIVYDSLIKELNINKLQELSNKCHSINNFCKGDGCGLSSGNLIDIFITNFFSKNFNGKCDIYHNGECDLKISNIPLSFKKISGKSSIALDWSKNKNNFKKKYFTTNILILNLKTGRWWKKENNKIIYSGIYIIDKEYCIEYVKLSSNNKTNSLISSEFVYEMLIHCIDKKKFIKIPECNKTYEFNILNSFTELK